VGGPRGSVQSAAAAQARRPAVPTARHISVQTPVPQHLCTLHPAPSILHPKLCTLHPTPYTLQPA